MISELLPFVRLITPSTFNRSHLTDFRFHSFTPQISEIASLDKSSPLHIHSENPCFPPLALCADHSLLCVSHPGSKGFPCSHLFVPLKQGVAGDSCSQRPTKTLHVSRDMSRGRSTHVPAEQLLTTLSNLIGLFHGPSTFLPLNPLSCCCARHRTECTDRLRGLFENMFKQYCFADLCTFLFPHLTSHRGN